MYKPIFKISLLPKTGQITLTPPQLSNQNVRTGGGVGCAGCHRPPEFDIDPGSANNGVDHEAGNPQGFDTTNTKSPTLRDVFNSAGIINTPMMHTGDFLEFTTIIEHYNEVIPDVDNRILSTLGWSEELVPYKWS